MLINSKRHKKHLSKHEKLFLNKLVLTVLIIMVFLPAIVNAQAKVGTTGAQFLELAVSARSMGMGDAFTAISDDVSAIYYNPAGLTSLLGREAMFTYIRMPADINYGFGAVAFPLESIGGVLAIGTYALSAGWMIERTYQQGTYEGTGREFGAVDLAFTVGYGRYLTDRFSMGLSVKYIGEYYHNESASGWAVDVGTSYDTGYRGFKIAMVITNFGPDLKMLEHAYPLPINFRFGGCINLVDGVDNILTLSMEGSHPSDNLEKYNMGLEYVFKERYILRAGNRLNYDVDGLTFGGGVRVPFNDEQEIHFDYAFQDFGILTQVHRFTMSILF